MADVFWTTLYSLSLSLPLSFFVLQVIDGTTCDLKDDVPRVCVDGECVAVGCDGELGGERREDKCRVCGGQGDGCNTVEGVLDDKASH